MEMCKLLHEENGLFPMNEQSVRNVLHLAFAKKGGMVGVIGEPGKIEGMIYLLISTFWYSDDWHLSELFNWVRPEYRRSHNAKHLIQFAKKCAVELKIPLVIGVISNERTEQKVRLYQRQLSKPHGSWFVYNSKWDRPAEALASN